MNNTCILIINTDQIKVSNYCLERKKTDVAQNVHEHFFYKSFNEIFERKHVDFFIP